MHSKKNLQFEAVTFKLHVISKIDTAFQNTGYNWYDVNVVAAKVVKLNNGICNIFNHKY